MKVASTSKVDMDLPSFVLYQAYKLILFMINLSYLDSLNDVEIYSALKRYIIFAKTPK